MAVSWSPDQERRVANVIEAHPVESGECVELSAALLPIARECDPRSHRVKIRPASRLMRFVVPRVVLDRPWSHHATTVVEAHGVDALTGVPGTAWEAYLELHFAHADALHVEQLGDF